MKALTFLSFAMALGAVLLSVSDFAGSEGPSRSSTVLGSAGADEALQKELALLHQTSQEILERLRGLEERQTALELNPPTREPVAEAVETSQLEALKSLAAVLDNPDAVASSNFEALVLDVLAYKEKQDQDDRDRRRLQATEDRVNERIVELREELGLTSRQANDMGRVLTHEQIRREEFFGKMREGGSFGRDSIRAGMREIREEAYTELEKVLAPDQYDRYVEMEGDRRGGWRGGDRGGDARGGGGGSRWQRRW